jgi:choline dehydrogenase-like flavoprotein
VRDDRRVSTNDAYLEPARARPNLTILGDTQVERVLLDGRRAVGVCTSAGVEHRAAEVWVCAGAIHSPALLLRSGVTDRPVGENLVEHQMLPLVLVLNERERARAAGARTVSALLRYSSGLADAGPNDMQMLPLTPFGLEPPESGLAVLGVCAMRVFSRGRVTLAPGDPVTAPRIEFRMLSDPRDRERLRDGFRRAVALVRHPAVAGLADLVLAGRTPLAELESSGALEPSGGRESSGGLDRWMDENVTNYVHAAGSCRMGAADDPAAVVDLDCRLIGYSGLGVLDASVLPDLPTANPHLTVVAVAERIAVRTADHLAGPVS